MFAVHFLQFHNWISIPIGLLLHYLAFGVLVVFVHIIMSSHLVDKTLESGKTVLVAPNRP